MNQIVASDFSRAVLASIFKPISTFASAVRGAESLEVCLYQLANAVGARSALLSRKRNDDQMARIVAKSQISKSGIGTTMRPFCDNVLEADPWAFKVGACIFRSRVDDVSASSRTIIDRWYQASGCRDTLVMVLEVDKGHVDRIEMHFDHIASSETVSLCEQIAHALPLFYKLRAPQVIEDAIQRNLVPGNSSRASASMAILSEHNPYHLTRSEYRICHVISRGVSYKALPEKLDISPHTVRSHLRNIYGKTDIGDFYELSHRLVSIEERMASSAISLMAS